jgi:RNA polymerase sigma-70 factor, ECF subfamily
VDYPAQDDTTLLRLIAQGQADALSQLYDRYGRLVFSVALYIVHNRQTAEEVTLDVFTRVWQKAGTYRPEQARVRTWLATIARHQAIDALRRQATRPEGQAVSWETATGHNPSITHQPTSDPAELAALSLQRQRIRAAVAQLPAEQRQALELAYFMGHTQGQIAAVLNIPLGTVKTRIRLAMQKLRRLLESEEILNE